MSSSFFCPDAQAFLRLLHTPDGLLAVRSLNPQAEWHFTSATLKEALPLLEKHSGSRALYACLNPVRADMGDGYAQDEDITALRWLPFDADPIRPPDTASTDADKAAATAALDALLDALRVHLPGLDNALIRGDSGNGAHALLLLPGYPPHGAEGGRSGEWHRLKRIHTALCKRYSTAAVKLDTSVLNPSRIWRLYGTLNVKGEDTPERPHRLARLLSVPTDLRPLDILAYDNALTETLAIAPPPSRPNPPASALADPEGGGPCERGTSEQGGGAEFPPWWNETVTPGERNSAAYRRTRWLLNATEGNRTDADAWDHVSAWNKVLCRPPLSEDELRKTFDSARKAGDNPAYAAPPAPLRDGEGGEERAGRGSEAPWPQPLGEAAYYGLAGEIVRAIEPHTEADPAAVLVQLLVAVGSAIGPSPYFTIEDTPHRANLFAVVVGKSAIARKGTSWGRVRGVMAHTVPEWAANNICSGLSSGEGLIHAVRDAEEKREAIKEKGRIVDYQMVTVDEGVADKRLLVVEGEFVGVLKQTEREGNILSVVIRNAWDGLTLQTLTKNRQRATGAHISIIGHITVDEQRRYLSSTEAANGFANRFLWLCARRSKLLPFGGRPDAALLSALSERLALALAVTDTPREIFRDSDADSIWAEVYPDLPRETPGLLGSVITRAGAIVMRLALIYALLDRSAVIRAPHLMAALALWEYAEASCRFIFGDSLGDPLADDLLRRLRAAGEVGMTRTDINNAFGRHKDARRLDRALALLLDHRRIRSERTDTGGRPQEVIFAV